MDTKYFWTVKSKLSSIFKLFYIKKFRFDRYLFSRKTYFCRKKMMICGHPFDIHIWNRLFFFRSKVNKWKIWSSPLANTALLWEFYCHRKPSSGSRLWIISNAPGLRAVIEKLTRNWIAIFTACIKSGLEINLNVEQVWRKMVKVKSMLFALFSLF